MLTPVERYGDFWVKRDDLFSWRGGYGGKARSIQFLLKGKTVDRLVSGGARNSSQGLVLAAIAYNLKVPCVFHTSTGDLGASLTEAKKLGVMICRHTPGYSSVIKARAFDDALRNGGIFIPPGLSCLETIEAVSPQVENIPEDSRLVVPVGSGMSLAGILNGLCLLHRSTPVLGVIVGGSPVKQLEEYAPVGWKKRVTLVYAEGKYEKPFPANIGDLKLNPFYESKCVPFLQPNDTLWVVGA